MIVMCWLAAIGVVAGDDLLRQLVHAVDVVGLGAHGGELGELRFDAQANLHDFHEIGAGNHRSDVLAPVIRTLAGIGARPLTPPDAAFGLEHFQRPTDGAAADAEHVRKRPLGRQFPIRLQTIRAQQPPKLL
jgi:hypothetical protein